MVAALTLDEIISVDSVAGLRDRYEGKGTEFSSEGEFLTKVKADWKLARQWEIVRASEEETKSEPSYIEVNVAGTTYRIYGFDHNRMHGQPYWKMIKESMDKKEELLVEQNLGQAAKLNENYLEIADHCLVGSYPLVNGLKSGLISPLVISPLLAAGIVANTIFRKPFKKFQQERGELMLRVLSNLHPEVATHTALPAYVDLEIKQRKVPAAYTQIQARSAYQAEFMLAWQPGRAEKEILVGTWHVPEIKYFLKHGVPEQRIVDLAQSHVEMLESDPEQYGKLVQQLRIKGTIQQTASFLTSAAATTYGLIKLIRR